MKFYNRRDEIEALRRAFTLSRSGLVLVTITGKSAG